MHDEPKESYWEHFEHRADIGVRGVGPDKAIAFTQAAIGLTAVITEPEKVKADIEIKITCQDSDNEVLFVDWLNSLIYEMATRQMLFSRFEVRIEAGRLKASAWGEKVNVEEHQPAVEIKGATYTALSVKQDENQNWVAQCVVDV